MKKEIEPILQEPILQEPILQEPILQEPILQEPILQEPILQEPTLQKPIQKTEHDDNLLAYPKGIYNWIFNVCFIHIIYILFAFYNELYLCGFLGIALFTTSLNYWKYPILNSYRRYIDIIVAIIAISYHYYLSIIKNNLFATLIMSLGILMYPLNHYLYNNNYIKQSVVCHCLLHILNSLGACYIYKYYYI